jgi:hypothetical protein
MADALALDPRTWPREDVLGLGLIDEDVDLLRGVYVTSQPRLNKIDKDTHTNKLQHHFWKPITKNSKVKRAWLGAMGDRP